MQQTEIQVPAKAPVIKRCAFGVHELVIETGQIAKQASGAAGDGFATAVGDV